VDSKEREWKEVDWIHVAQNREKWRDVVNTVMDLVCGWQRSLIRVIFVGSLGLGS
jgi:hypothetical protein